MNEKKYLIYLDILGFEGLAEEISSEKGIDPRDVRKKFIEVIKERVERLEAKGKIIGKKYGESDDWLLVTDALDKVFNCILEILDHDTGYRDYEKVPLEIGIGTGKYDKWARFDGTNLIVEDGTIKFYKTNITGYYNKLYKQSPKPTFIVLTESAYHELEPLDIKICQEIEYKKDGGNEEVVTFFVADVDKVQRRGRVFEFLEKIGYPGSNLYGRIDEVYVPPSEYEEMARALEEKRILFVTGTPEYGKTYTAVRLMWEFYNRGYEPRWNKGGELAERIEVRRKLEDIRSELKPGRIIYFEDPFGKIGYERRESLEREIGTTIDSVEQVEDVYVVITSREEVFKEFEKEKLSAKELKEFEEKLNIKKPSYGYEKRKEILLNWAEEENCKWRGNRELKDFVLESIKDEKTLPTPLSIRGFVVATSDIEKEDKLKEELKEKSMETAKAFAKEIKNMSDDKVLFLSFPFISSYFEIEVVRATYHELVEELNLNDAWRFDRVLEWFKKDKISISDRYIRFSHSSYYEAFEYFFTEEGHSTINDIFNKLFIKLLEKDEIDRYAAWTVAHNFDKFHKDVRNKLLLILSEKEEAASAVMHAVTENFDKLPEDIRNKVLPKLSEYGEVAIAVGYFAANNFDKLSNDLRNLLFEPSWNEGVALGAAIVLKENFDELSIDARNVLLLKLSERNGVVAECVAAIVACNFYELPNDVRNELLLKLLEKDGADRWVAWTIASYFDELPDDVRNSLFKLSEKNEEVRTEAVKLMKTMIEDATQSNSRINLQSPKTGE